MKASELIKHLEDGGKLKCIKGNFEGAVFGLGDFPRNLQVMALEEPQNFVLVEKLYRCELIIRADLIKEYSFFDDNSSILSRCLGIDDWECDDSKCRGDLDKRLKITVEEIEG